MYKVAILYICTGKYDVFWKDFYESFEKYFLVNSHKEYYVFTDADEIYEEKNTRVHKIFQENLGWPDNTLKRFHIFLKQEEELKKYSYIFFFNANMKCMEEIGEDEFLPSAKDKEELVAVQHPGWYLDVPLFFTYERNKKSTAHIPYSKGRYYVCGGVNGGKSAAYIEMMHRLKENIDEDESNGIIARFHDESHLNKYMLNRNHVKILSPSFCFPEGYSIPLEKKILLKSKKSYFDVDTIKKTKRDKRIKNYINKGLRMLARKICGKRELHG